jgi:hypothetical protein
MASVGLRGGAVRALLRPPVIGAGRDGDRVAPAGHYQPRCGADGHDNRHRHGAAGVFGKCHGTVTLRQCTSDPVAREAGAR